MKCNKDFVYDSKTVSWYFGQSGRILRVNGDTVQIPGGQITLQEHFERE